MVFFLSSVYRKAGIANGVTEEEVGGSQMMMDWEQVKGGGFDEVLLL